MSFSVSHGDQPLLTVLACFAKVVLVCPQSAHMQSFLLVRIRGKMQYNSKLYPINACRNTSTGQNKKSKQLTGTQTSRTSTNSPIPLNTHTHTHTHAHTHTHMHTHTQTHSLTHTHTHIYTNTHTHTYTQTDRQTQTQPGVNPHLVCQYVSVDDVHHLLISTRQVCTSLFH